MKTSIHRSLCAALGAAAVIASIGCGGNSSDTPVSPLAASSSSQTAQQGHNPFLDANIQVPDSTIPKAGEMHTNHLILAGRSKVMPAAFVGYSPAQIRTAYGIPAGGGQGTIVIVDAFDDKYALNDFNTFSTQYGLPIETSTNVTASTNQHLQVVYAGGKKPRFNTGWSQEADLDIEWAHAIAPNAKIVLVEAQSNTSNNLYAADDMAATIANAHECSNSWSGGESSNEANSDSHFSHTGIVYFFSSGDTGGARGYPAASPNVVAVGGTSLLLNGSNGRSSETAWSGAGCGPSAFEPRPSYQAGITGVVGSARGIADVSAVSDPNTGVSVRWNGNWYIFGGTSVACPLIAAVTNVAGANRTNSQAEDTFIYSKLGTSSFFDVTSGSAGGFSAASGWDWPTGVGAPNGTGGF